MSATALDQELDVLRPLTEHAKRIGVDVSALYRWISPRGVKLSDGSRMRLPATRLPGSWRVTRRDLESFLSRLTEDRVGGPAPAIESPAQRRRSIEQADAALQAAGF